MLMWRSIVRPIGQTLVRPIMDAQHDFILHKLVSIFKLILEFVRCEYMIAGLRTCKNQYK